MAGLPTTCGVPEWRDFVSQHDAPAVVRAARQAPCCWARPMSRPCSPTGSPPTPSTGERTIPGTSDGLPEGSSGGSAAAIAAGLCALEVGSDIGGSIRVPAVFCGVYGHRPSETLLPKSGQFPLPPLPNSLRRHGRAGSDRPQRRGPGAGAVHPRRPRGGRGRSLAGRVAARPPGPARRFPRGGAAPDPWLAVDDEIRRRWRSWRRASAGSAPPSRRSSPTSSGTIGAITSCTGRCSPR